MKNEKRKFSAEFKVKVIREHLENQVPVGKLCEQFKIHLYSTFGRKSSSMVR
jgi:transposase